MRRMNILENKISCKYLYEKRGRFLSTFKVLAAAYNIKKAALSPKSVQLSGLDCT